MSHLRNQAHRGNSRDTTTGFGRCCHLLPTLAVLVFDFPMLIQSEVFPRGSYLRPQNRLCECVIRSEATLEIVEDTRRYGLHW